MPLTAALCNPDFGLAMALSFLDTLELWKEHQTWSLGAVFASISVADSLDPGHVSLSPGLSFPICNMTRLMVFQMFLSSIISSYDVQCQSPEYKTDQYSWPWSELGQGASSSGHTATLAASPTAPPSDTVHSGRLLGVMCVVY